MTEKILVVYMKFLRILFFICVYVYVSVCGVSVSRGQKRILDPLGLECKEWMKS